MKLHSLFHCWRSTASAWFARMQGEEAPARARPEGEISNSCEAERVIAKLVEWAEYPRLMERNPVRVLPRARVARSAA